MSILFSPFKIGQLEVKNRLMHSATYESMAEKSGEVTDALIKRYRNLTRGKVGLIVTGHMCVHPLGKAGGRQTGIHADEMIPGLKKLVIAVHDEGGKIIFQLNHAGRQTRTELIGHTPMGPSNDGKDPTFGIEPRVMTNKQIQDTITAYVLSAERAVKAGADGVQIHAAHGYLISQFLSPFFNRRNDDWGGSDEKRFAFLKKVISEIKKTISSKTPILIKLNTDDFTPQPGITKKLAAKYASWLSDMGVAGIEISSGTLSYSSMAMSRKVDTDGVLGFVDGYHLEAAKIIRPEIGQLPLLLVGGMRKIAHMEEVLESGAADMISMCRPFIREPHLAKNLQSGKIDKVACISCNNCLTAVRKGLPVRCYHRGLPEEK